MYNKEIEIRIEKPRGYRYFLDKKHPLANIDGRVYYHRHIASIKVGRWIGKLEHVHHVDGDVSNNSPDNLAILTNREHQAVHKRTPQFVEIHNVFCPSCEKVFPTAHGIYCSPSCASKAKRKVERPDRDELYKLVWRTPTECLAKSLGVSGAAIAKWCKIYNISKPPRGYWSKK